MAQLNKLGDQLSTLARRLGIEENSDARAELSSFLDQLIHDLNNPLSTYALEFHSIGAIAKTLMTAAESNDMKRVAAEAEVLADIHDNIERARERSGSIVAELESASNQLRGED